MPFPNSFMVTRTPELALPKLSVSAEHTTSLHITSGGTGQRAPAKISLNVGFSGI